jgi:uncharacterized protein (DUF58 family)
MTRSSIPGARFIDPAVLSRIGNLELLARHVVEGFINGLHRAPYFGASIDFAEHRGYVAGDDIRRVDWRLFARTDRYFVKQYEADTNTNLNILFDVSRSMAFASRGVSKLEYGSYVAACLAYLAHRQRDRVGIVTFDSAIVTHVPPSAKHFDVVLQTLDRAAAERPGNLAAPLNAMAEHFRRRGLLVLISDFYELDPAEIEFGFDDASSFEDLESGEQVPVVPESLRAEYREMIQAHIKALGTKFSEHRIDYTVLNTSEPLDRALFSYLSSRERLLRIR